MEERLWRPTRSNLHHHNCISYLVLMPMMPNPNPHFALKTNNKQQMLFFARVSISNRVIPIPYLDIPSTRNAVRQRILHPLLIWHQLTRRPSLHVTMSPYHALTPVTSPLAYQNESVGARPSTASHQRCCCCTIFKLPDYTAAAAASKWPILFNITSILFNITRHFQSTNMYGGTILKTILTTYIQTA